MLFATIFASEIYLRMNHVKEEQLHFVFLQGRKRKVCLADPWSVQMWVV